MNKLKIKLLVLIVYFLLIISIIFFLSSCNPLSVEPLSNYIINKGSHDSYSYNYFNVKNSKIKPIFLKKSRLYFEFRFNKSHMYDFNIKDGNDINKLYGITSLYIHKNSARFGWRYIGKNNFEIFAYYYIRGKRNFKIMGVTKLNQLNKFSIDVSKNKYLFEFNNNTLKIPNTKNTLVARTFPYFGGNNYAPHKMYFLIIEL